MWTHSSAEVRSSATGVWGLALLLLFCGVDLHSSRLNPTTFETPHPVFHVCGKTSQAPHLEPAGSAMAPAHEPVLSRRSVLFCVLGKDFSQRLSRTVGLTLQARVDNLPTGRDGCTPSPRGPPQA